MKEVIDLVDDSDQAVRQVIRDAIDNGSLANINNIVSANFEAESVVRFGTPSDFYVIESYRLRVVVMQS